MHATVAGDQQGFARRQQFMRSLFQSSGRNARIDAGQRKQQALVQHHLAIIGAGGLLSIWSEIEAGFKTPADCLKPLQT
ncbi:hypothetical protein GCM10007205_06470 [Oxalicibacterium flavum]|uniref:Uncharacterized protein n=1 Tax=Oxalicibacterium flavum TaxID=179467 RepID=A0A8J2UJJ8_9BURK|nr:hypothetical protein GCM10007205_06470 [Oxalicibacterium flavum]